MIEFHDPRGETATPEEKYELSHHIAADGSGTTVGLLANGFPDSENFLREVAKAMQELEPSIKVFNYNKGKTYVFVR